MCVIPIGSTFSYIGSIISLARLLASYVGATGSVFRGEPAFGTASYAVVVSLKLLPPTLILTGDSEGVARATFAVIPPPLPRPLAAFI